MSLLLYISGQLADLDPAQLIAQTKQVNDIASIENRQAGYTNKFSLPKTATNVRIMQFLSLPGSTTDIPYKKIECSLYSATGGCFIYKGWAVVTDGGTGYDVAVYDGIIDLYKAIENKTLANLELTEINHEKTPATVSASWAAGANYRYILADYNGSKANSITDGVVSCDIEYLVPSVHVPYLWDKLFSTYGFEPQGSIFQSDDFTNLWMTFPKGTTHDESLDTQVFLNEDINISGNPNGDYRGRYLVFNSGAVINEITVINSQHIKVAETARYLVEVSGNINANAQVSVNVGKNAQDLEAQLITNYTQLVARQENGADFSYTYMPYLTAGDSLCVFFKNNGNWFDFGSDTSLTLRVTKINNAYFDFGQAFADFALRDFVNEIVYRFGLTLFKDKYTNACLFLTPRELLQASQSIDWSSRYISTESQNYIYGSYAQRNTMGYNYTDKEFDYNDGAIEVDNVNLADTKVLIKSKLYSPDRQAVSYIGRRVNVYRLWDKELKDDPEDGEDPFNYKPLDKRYYFMRCQPDGRTFKLYSSVTSEYTVAAGGWIENFSGLSFSDSIQAYYGPLANVLGRSQLVTATFWLSEADVSGIDFTKQYYIEQLGANFLMNKINNYIPGKVTTCELVRVLPQLEEALPVPAVLLNAVLQIIGTTNYAVHFSFQALTYMPGAALRFLASQDGTAWQEMKVTYTANSPVLIITSITSWLYWRIEYAAQGLLSNTVFLG